LGSKASIAGFAVLPDNTFLTLSDDDSTVRRWKVGYPKALEVFSGATEHLRAIALVQDFTFVAVGGDIGGAIYKYESAAQSASEIFLTGHAGRYIPALAVLPDGSYLTGKL
jgi:WD40 repeat protein